MIEIRPYIPLALLIASVASLFMLLYVGNLKPTWRGEMFGLLLLIVARIVFYSAATASRLYPESFDMSGTISLLSSFNSVLEGAVAVSYGIVVIVKMRSAS